LKFPPLQFSDGAADAAAVAGFSFTPCFTLYTTSPNRVAVPSSSTTAIKTTINLRSPSFLVLISLSTMTHTHYIKVDELLAPKTRLDKYLTSRLPELSRSRVQWLIENGHVRKSGQTVSDSSSVVKPGDTFSIHVPEATPSDMQPTEIPLKIVFEDAHMLVIDKPAGLTVHPGAGNHQDTMANALLAYCGSSLSGIGGVQRPGIVHRLDKDTSGLLVVAKHDKAHHSLSGQIASRELKRTYLALVWGAINPPAGSVSANIGRSLRNRKKMAIMRSGGKTATTHYKTKEIYGNGLLSLVECRLETGRTHQIRVHLTHLGHGLVGDQTYGSPHNSALATLPKELRDPVRYFPRQALHSHQIGFTHPESGEWMEFKSELPSDISQLVDILKNLYPTK
jgi:23S rRNA pseudouridine1911/1915/1917 synthase